MTNQIPDDTGEIRRAAEATLHEAKVSREYTEQKVEEAYSAMGALRKTTEANGYTRRFRQLLGGA